MGNSWLGGVLPASRSHRRMTLFQLLLVAVLVPAAAYGVGRGLEDPGLTAALFLALAFAALVFGATGLAAGTPGASVTLLVGLPLTLLGAGSAFVGARGASP